MSLPPSRKPSSGQRRRSVGTVNGRFSLSETSITHPGKIRGDGSPAARTLPNTPRRQVKLSCSENHGIRAPPPEQYLTPMQQKELCIRHLRARLRDNVERLQHRDSEISGLRAQLLRMQEDWIHEEVQRLEAHLELQEARREISVLQDEVRASSQEPHQQHQDPHQQQEPHQHQEPHLHQDPHHQHQEPHHHQETHHQHHLHQEPHHQHQEPHHQHQKPHQHQEPHHQHQEPHLHQEPHQQYHLHQEPHHQHQEPHHQHQEPHHQHQEPHQHQDPHLHQEPHHLHQEPHQHQEPHHQHHLHQEPHQHQEPHLHQEPYHQHHQHQEPHHHQHQEPHYQPQLHPGARSGGRSRSCGCSPAGTLSRGAPLQPEGLRGPRQTHLLLLEAAMLSEPRGHNSTRGPSSSPTSSPCSSSYERLFLPVSHSCSCIAHTPHTHLYLHLPQEEARGPASDPPIPTPTPPVEKKVEVRSQACSPTISWLWDEAPTPLSETHFQSHLPGGAPPHIVEPPDRQQEAKEPLTCQPPPTAPLPERQDAVEIEDDEGGEEDVAPPPLCHWSRYFLVDLLALAMPVVPTVAWMWGGAQGGVLPGYHMGSLLRGCCAVALTSLRREGGAGEGDPPTLTRPR